MGVNIYLKAYTDSQGRSQLELKARSRGQSYSRALFKIKREDFDSNNVRIKATNTLATKYNKELSEIKELMHSSYELYQAELYSWDELIRRLEGGSSTLDMESFAKDVFSGMKDVSYNNILNALKTWRRILGTDTLLFTDINYAKNMQVINKLRSTHSASTINVYLGYIASTYNEAYSRGLVPNKFLSNKRYRQKVQLKINTFISAEDFKEALTKIDSIYAWQSMAFYLLSFTSRGLYPLDLAKLHLNIKENQDISNAKRYFLHRRSKTDESMIIQYSLEPIEDIIATIQHSLIHTHKIDNRGTMKLFNYDVDNWKAHRYTWAVYQLNIKRILGQPLKVARKSFETIAVNLDISLAVRTELLGHTDSSIKSHYIQWESKELRAKIDDSHKLILDKFKAVELWRELKDIYYTRIKPQDIADKDSVYIGS